MPKPSKEDVRSTAEKRDDDMGKPSPIVGFVSVRYAEAGSAERRHWSVTVKLLRGLKVDKERTSR